MTEEAKQSFIDIVRKFALDLGLPQVEVDKLVAAHQKNFEALMQTARITAEGAKSVAAKRRQNIGDCVDVPVRKNHEHPLAGIFLPVRVFDIVEKPAAFNGCDNILETYPSLGNMRHWSLIRTEYCPARSPFNASRRLPGGARREAITPHGTHRRERSTSPRGQTGSSTGAYGSATR